MPSPFRVNRPFAPKAQPRPFAQLPDPNASRGGDTRFYRTAPWRNLRAEVLAGEPLCRNCHQQNKLTEATMVDHITPINKGGEPLDPANLQPLCYRCHARKSAKDK